MLNANIATGPAATKPGASSLERFPANRTGARLLWAKGWLILLLPLVWPATPSSADSIVTIEGQDPVGPHIVLVVRAPACRASIGIARQIATIPLARGRLTIVETRTTPAEAHVSELPAGAVPRGERPDWVWFDAGSVPADDEGEKLTAPTIRLRADTDGNDLRRIARQAWRSEARVHVLRHGEPFRLAQRGAMVFQYPPATPLSRQVRYTRQLVIELLRAGDSIADEADFAWDRLRDCAPQLLAIYDAEGIGGSGAARLEQIAADRLDGVGVYRVCGEDIRRGALAPAAGVIFPGGSGRGIGNGLQADGRQIVRDFVAAGGGYLGVCAGAYFAASGLENYLHAIRLRHSQPWARGRGWLDIELTPEGEALFGDQAPILRTRYSNGPVFLAADQPEGPDPGFVVLARFKTPSTDGRGKVRNEMVGEAAIGALEYGQGRLLIISPHPESHAEHHDFVARAIAWTLERKPASPPPPADVR